MADKVRKQARKYHLSLAGEFFVAAELQRRGIAAAVTYGNAKSADVIAFSQSGEKCVVIEVKSTAQSKWVVGNVVPQPSSQPWVFVHIPDDNTFSPSFYILLQSELHDILMAGHKAWNERYKAKWGKNFTGIGVTSLSLAIAEGYRDAWGKIEDLLVS